MPGAQGVRVEAMLVFVVFVLALLAVVPPARVEDVGWIDGPIGFARFLSYDNMACISLFFSNASHSLTLAHIALVSLFPETALLLPSLAVLFRRLPCAGRAPRLKEFWLRILACHPHQAPPLLA